MCGKYIQDCSCNQECKSKGNCCYDFESRQCSFILENALNSSDEKCIKNKGCELCSNSQVLESDNSQSLCLQCGDDYFLYKGKCYYKTCPTGTQANYINKVCSENSKLFNNSFSL